MRRASDPFAVAYRRDPRVRYALRQGREQIAELRRQVRELGRRTVARARERAAATTTHLVPFLLLELARARAALASLEARGLTGRHRGPGPSLASCLDHVTASPRTGPPAGTRRIASRPEALLTSP